MFSDRGLPSGQPWGNDKAPQESPEPDRSRSYLAAVLVIAVLVVAKLAAAVIAPLAFALFLMALFWPSYVWLSGRSSRALAVVALLVVCLVALAVLGGGTFWVGRHVFETVSFDEIQNRADDVRRHFPEWLRPLLPTDGGEAPLVSKESATTYLESAGRSTMAFLSGVTLALAFFALGLLEVRGAKARVFSFFPRASPRVSALLHEVGHDFRRYVVVRTGIGLITGLAVAGLSLLLGLELPILWGLLNFLLNYVPTIGSIVGVIPPVLFALVQFEDPLGAVWVLLCIGGVQLVMGNYIDPLLQGKFLSLSPFVVLLSVVFWGYLWGVAGALLAVPLTSVMVVVCREFESTRFFAALLARDEA